MAVRYPSFPGFARFQCDGCHAETLVPFSCKRRGLCPSWLHYLSSAPEAAVQEAPELLFEEGKKAGGISAGGGREEGLQVFAHDLVEDGACCVAGRVPQGRNGGMAIVARGGLAKCGH
jgi:hypothetical protein